MDVLIPPPRDDDDEDVYLALQTAKALWSRNEREDALRWLRRAAEQASDANADDRALELFKAAAEMASRLQAAAAPSAPPARSGGPPPPPNRQPVELAPGPRSGGPPPPPNRQPVELAPGRPSHPGAQPSTAPPPHLSSAPPPPPPAAYGASGSAPAGAPGGAHHAYSVPGYDGPGRPSPPYPSTPAPPPARPAPVPSRPPAPPPSGVSAVPLLRPKNPGGAAGQRPPAFTPSAPPVRPTPAQPQVPQVPPGAHDVRPSLPRVPQAEAPRADRRAGTMLGPAVAPAAPTSASLEADFDDDSQDAPTKVGRLPPEFQRPAAQARPAQPAVPPAPAPQPQSRKARRKTLSRGEQSPLHPGRRPDGRTDTRDGRDGRGGQPEARDGRDGRGAGGGEPRKARDAAGRSGQLPSEVPTAPGNDSRVGAARAAALRALAVADEEVTAQRDIAALHRFREMRVDDLDEDTSVLPGLKLDASGRAVGLASPGGREGREGRESKQRAFDDDTTRRVSERELAQGLAALRQGKGGLAATVEDDRPTPTDADADLAAAEQDLSATVPPDTSRSSAASVETAALDSTARYSAIDAAWITAAEARGATPVLHSPATVPQPPAPSVPSAPSAGASAASTGRGTSAASAHVPPAPSTAGPTSRDAERRARPITPTSPAPAPAAAPLLAFRVVVLGPDPAGGGAVRVTRLAPGARAPTGATVAMLVPTTETESAELARLFGAAD